LGVVRLGEAVKTGQLSAGRGEVRLVKAVEVCQIMLCYGMFRRG